jgi:CheY-like chemotaxis protein
VETIQLLLADDDHDDCLLFKDALEELSVRVISTIVHNGAQLMHHLNGKTEKLPDVLFLDLNMPLKNGFDCLEEIKQNEKLKALPVIIFSTSFDEHVIDLLYKNGAQYYICKPAAFTHLKKVIHQALILISSHPASQPSRDKFLLSGLKPSSS